MVFYGEIKTVVISRSTVADEESNRQMPMEFSINKGKEVFEVIHWDANNNVHNLYVNRTATMKLHKKTRTMGSIDKREMGIKQGDTIPSKLYSYTIL